MSGKWFELIAEKFVCHGKHFERGYLQTVEECFRACASNSSLFIYARMDEVRCTTVGCFCYCEEVTKDGECITVVIDDQYFDLYKVGKDLYQKYNLKSIKIHRHNHEK